MTEDGEFKKHNKRRNNILDCILSNFAGGG